MRRPRSYPDCRATTPSTGLAQNLGSSLFCDAPSESDEVGVPKPFAVIENGNHLRDDPNQEDAFLSGQCVFQDLRKLPEHQLAHAGDLIWVGHWVRPATHGQASDFLPVEVGQCNCERDLVVICDVLCLLGFSLASE